MTATTATPEYCGVCGEEMCPDCRYCPSNEQCFCDYEKGISK